MNNVNFVAFGGYLTGLRSDPEPTSPEDCQMQEVVNRFREVIKDFHMNTTGEALVRCHNAPIIYTQEEFEEVFK